MAIPNNPAALGKVTVSSPGTPVSILKNFSSDPAYSGLISNKIDIQAAKDNTGRVFLGYFDMDSGTGFGVLRELDPGESWSITDPSAGNVFDVGKFYIDAEKEDEGVYASAHVR